MERPGRENYAPRQEKSKNPSEGLRRLLGDISKELNHELETLYNINGLINTDCSIAAENFSKDRGGIYGQASINRDNDKIYQKELDFSSAQKPPVQKYYHEKYGTQTVGDIVNQWRQNKENAPNGRIEQAISAVLYKMLKESFIVVRASTYDDYYAGVDNLIINKQTGDVICAFDEVHTSDDKGKPDERLEIKKEKVLKIAKEGGVEVRYGLTINDGKLKKTKLESIPVFYLGLNSEELELLLGNMSYSLSDKATEIEYTIFKKLVDSLKEQSQRLQNVSIPQSVAKNLIKFNASLAQIEQMATQA